MEITYMVQYVNLLVAENHADYGKRMIVFFTNTDNADYEDDCNNLLGTLTNNDIPYLLTKSQKKLR